jgi:pyruvate/2-oxoglutarate dehydrogenase complex dihydrolipoamide dehydrogenase (E3) component
MAARAGVKVVTGRQIGLEDIRGERPDVLILATGTKPFLPAYVPGIDREMVTNYDDVIRGRTDVGVSVVVIGGQLVGMTAAEFLAEKGADVIVVEATGSLATDLEYMAQKVLLARVAANKRITVRLNTNVEEITDEGVVLQSGGVRETIDGIDQVVVALEREMEQGLQDQLTGGLADELGIELHSIGDMVWPREPYDAVLDGTLVGRMI